MVEQLFRLVTGRDLDLRSGSLAITAEEAGHHLALLNRYGGATKFPYPVALHAVLVSDICMLLQETDRRELIAFLGLHHDIGEIVVCDTVNPVKQHLDKGDDHRQVLEYKVWRDSLQQMLGDTYIHLDNHVHLADRLAFLVEQKYLFPDKLLDPGVEGEMALVNRLIPDLPVVPKEPIAWQDARDLYISRHRELINPALQKHPRW